jgi:hypothetical protein
MAKKFAEAKGFNLLCEVFGKNDWPWPGGEILIIILKTLNVPDVSYHLFLFYFYCIF